jgi:hypothetical protein
MEAEKATGSRFAYAHSDAIDAILRRVTIIRTVIHAGHAARTSDAAGSAAGLFHLADSGSRHAKARTVNSIFCWITFVCRVIDTSHPARAGNRTWSSARLMRNFQGFRGSLAPLGRGASLILGYSIHPACQGNDEYSEGDKAIFGFQVNFHRILLSLSDQEWKNHSSITFT